MAFPKRAGKGGRGLNDLLNSQAFMDSNDDGFDDETLERMLFAKLRAEL